MRSEMRNASYRNPLALIKSQLKDFILKIRHWIIFVRNKDSLPTESKSQNPKMIYENLSGAFIWEDEGLWECRNHLLQDAFKPVIHYRMQILAGQENDLGFFRSRKFDKQIYNMAKKYFPNWIGFQNARNSFNYEIADRILRVKKVEAWRYKKLLEE